MWRRGVNSSAEMDGEDECMECEISEDESTDNAQLPPPRNQLVGPEGDAVGQLPPRPQARLFGRSPPPAPLALAATWVALSGGAPYVSPLEVERAISRWRPDERTFSLGEYEKNLLQGRATVAAGYATLFGLQALVAVLLILQPLLGLLRGE